MADVLWRPDPDRRLSVLFDVFELSQRVRELLDASLVGTGLRPDEYAAYSVIFEAGPLTMTELARTLGMPLTTAADYVRSMSGRGHLRKAAHPSDGRATVLSLTPAGLRAHRKASAAFERTHSAFVAALDPLTEKSARDTLAHLITAAAAAGAPAAAAPLAAAPPRTARGPWT